MIRKTFAIYWRLMRPHRGLWFWDFISSFVFFASLSILLPWLVSLFVEEVSNLDGRSASDLYWFIWLWVGARVGSIIIGRLGVLFHIRAMTRTLRDIDLASFTTTMSHSSDFFANNFTGSIITKFNRFARSFELMANAVMIDLTALLVQIIFPFAILLFIAPVIAIALLVWVIPFIAILILLHKRKIPMSRKVASLDSTITGAAADAITNVLSIKMFSRFSSEFKSFNALSEERLSARVKKMFFNDKIRIYKGVSILTLQSVVFYFSIRFAVEGTLSVGEVVLIQIYIQQLSVSLWNFGKLVEKLEEAMADATEMTEIFELMPSVLDPASPEKPVDVKGTVNFENVEFTYDGDNEQAVFTNLDVSIPAGQKIGFVGPSGGGKTTLTKILLRFMDVNKGQITIDGQDISKITQDDLRRNIAYVPQEPLLFHRSIYENIRYGNPDATREEVMKAAKLAHADEFIAQLSSGYDTLVGERGVKLSGGQKQRVAIARAMLKKAPILVLDEATSALDSRSEKLITSALDDLMKTRTTLVIAHRLSTIKKLDRIIVLKDGEVVEDGSHAQLLKNKGLYSELWSHQHGDYLE